jgi:hypothetical protein
MCRVTDPYSLYTVPYGFGSGYDICSVADPGSGAFFYPWILDPDFG